MADKMSWREIDRMRDRGGRRGSRTSLEKALEDPRLKARYLEKAERLFMGPKGRPGHAKALQELHEAFGTPAFGAKVSAYMEEYGLPEDWRTLILLLDLDDPAIVVKALEQLAGMADEMGTVEKKGFLGKLKVLALTADDPDIQELAEELLETLR